MEKELLKQIASRLSNIDLDSMSLAEKQIAFLLKKAGYLALDKQENVYVVL
jgi:hypothetical protein